MIEIMKVQHELFQATTNKFYKLGVGTGNSRFWTMS